MAMLLFIPVTFCFYQLNINDVMLIDVLILCCHTRLSMVE